MGMLDRKKKKKEKFAEAAEQPPEKTAFEIGKTGTLEEIRAAFKTARARLDWFDRHDVSGQETVIKGAQAAFLEGNVENFQSILADPEGFAVLRGELLRSYKTTSHFIEILSELVKEHQDPAIIALATQKMDTEARQKLLNDTMYEMLRTGRGMSVESLDVLLKAGAQANMEVNGAAGAALALAASYSYPDEIIRLLHANGADFGAALHHINTSRDWDAENKRENAVTKLLAHREAITGEPATEEGKTQQMLKELMQQVAELTKRMDAAEKPAGAQKAVPKREPKTNDYPSM
jgi:hypothetical protein